ncbi:MAG: DUF4333 domain-containing protein [Candidatus Limnocylindria bacterium]
MARSRHRFGLLILSLALVGCGGSLTVTRYLDVERLEGTVADGITEQTGTAIQSVDCPDEVAMEAGNDFECAVTDEHGQTGTVQITQGEDGDTRWQLAGGISINVTRLEEVISDGITAQLSTVIASVECPDDVVMQAGNEFECTATDEQGNTGVVTVTQDDDAGNLTWKLEQ